MQPMKALRAETRFQAAAAGTERPESRRTVKSPGTGCGGAGEAGATSGGTPAPRHPGARTDLLGQLVEHDGAGDEPAGGGGARVEGDADDDAVGEVVPEVAEDNHKGERGQVPPPLGRGPGALRGGEGAVHAAAQRFGDELQREGDTEAQGEGPLGEGDAVLLLQGLGEKVDEDAANEGAAGEARHLGRGGLDPAEGERRADEADERGNAHDEGGEQGEAPFLGRRQRVAGGGGRLLGALPRRGSDAQRGFVVARSTVVVAIVVVCGEEAAEEEAAAVVVVVVVIVVVVVAVVMVVVRLVDAERITRPYERARGRAGRGWRGRGRQDTHIRLGAVVLGGALLHVDGCGAGGFDHAGKQHGGERVLDVLKLGGEIQRAVPIVVSCFDELGRVRAVMLAPLGVLNRGAQQVSDFLLREETVGVLVEALQQVAQRRLIVLVLVVSRAADGDSAQRGDTQQGGKRYSHHGGLLRSRVDARNAVSSRASDGSCRRSIRTFA